MKCHAHIFTCSGAWIIMYCPEGCPERSVRSTSWSFPKDLVPQTPKPTLDEAIVAARVASSCSWQSSHVWASCIRTAFIQNATAHILMMHSVHYNLFGVAVFAYKFHSMEILALHLWKKSWPGLRRLKLVSWNCCMPLWRDVMQNTALFAKMVFMRLRQRTFSKLRFVCLVKWLTKIIQVWSCGRNPIFAPVVTFLGRAKAWWKTVGRFVLQKIYPWVCWLPFWIWHGMWRSLRTPQWKDP